MEAEAAYDALHEQARDLQFEVKDALDEPDSPTAEQLCQELQHLEDELQQRKHPRTIEERIKTIKGLLAQARSGENAYMSVNDAVTFYDTFEDMRRTVHEHPDY